MFDKLYVIILTLFQIQSFLYFGKPTKAWDIVLRIKVYFSTDISYSSLTQILGEPLCKFIYPDQGVKEHSLRQFTPNSNLT